MISHGNKIFNIGGSIPFIIDVDAYKVIEYIRSTGVTITPTMQYAAHYLVTSLKSIGEWQTSNAVYGMMGGTEASHALNWKDTRNLDAANRLSFLGGGWAHNALGAKPNGTTSYASTFFTVNYDVNGVAPDMHISYSTNENTANISNEAVMGDRTSGSQCRLIIKRSNNTGFSLITQSTTVAGRLYTMPTDIRGLTIANKISSINKLYNKYLEIQGGADAAQNASVTATPITIGGVISPAPQFTDKRCNGATIGAPLTDDKALSMLRIFNNYNTILNRV